jgi:hypothetical protein
LIRQPRSPTCAIHRFNEDPHPAAVGAQWGRLVRGPVDFDVGVHPTHAGAGIDRRGMNWSDVFTIFGNVIVVIR